MVGAITLIFCTFDAHTRVCQSPSIKTKLQYPVLRHYCWILANLKDKAKTCYFQGFLETDSSPNSS